MNHQPLLHSLRSFGQRFLRDESGATAIEYGIICLLVVIGIIAIIDQIGTSLIAFFAAVIAGFN